MVLSPTSSHTDISLHSTLRVPASPTSDVALQIINDDHDDRESFVFCLPSTHWIIVGWALMVLSLGLVTFGFPRIDVQEHDLSKAFKVYITMLIMELGIWIPMCAHISPPEGCLNKTKLVLRASHVIFNHVSNISEQIIISSTHHFNCSRVSIFFNLFCGAVSFLIISALFWLSIDVERRSCFKWEHLPLGCNALLSATLLNISLFQIIVKTSFVHFPVFAILRSVIDLFEFIIRMVHHKGMA